MNLVDKITELYQRFSGNRADPQDVEVIGGWLEEAKRLMLLQSLKGHAGVKYVLEMFKSDVAKINEQLNKAYSKDMSDIERDRLLDRRNLAEKYVNLFDHVESDIEKLEDTIDRESIK